MTIKKIAITRFGGPEVLELVEVPTPALGPEDVLVKAHSIGVGWPDVYVRTGTYPWQHLFPMPATPGVEMSGTVAEIGAAVTLFRVGDPVYVSSGMLGMAGGCYAEARVVPQDRLMPLPPNLSLDMACNLAYYALATGILRECGRGEAASWVLVSGASGGLGTALVQIAKAAGHRVIATVGDEWKRSHSLSMGADHVLNYRKDNLKTSIAAITDGHGVDLWLESYAGPQFAAVLDHMAPWGRIVMYNAIGGHPPGSFFDAWRQHMAKCVSIQYFSSHVWENERDSIKRLGQQAIQLILSGSVVPPTGTYIPMAEAAEAHSLLESGHHVGRIFLRP